MEKFHCSIEIVTNVHVLYIYRSDLTCYLCDRLCRNQKLYDQHVEKCLAEATQIQKQIDTRGLEMIQDKEEDVRPPKRTTRATKATVLNSSTEGYSSGSLYYMLYRCNGNVPQPKVIGTVVSS